MKRFEGRTILITGAGSGIGQATARRFGAEGGRVFCADVNAAAAEATAAAIRGAGGEAAAAHCDVSDPDAVARTVDAAASRWTGLHVLANVAGIGGFRRTTEVTFEEWNRFLAVNLTGQFLTCQRALPHVLAVKGAIINTASVAGLKSHPYSAAYCASKGGVVMLTRALAVEYGRKGIRVNCVCPGGIETPFLSQFQLPDGVPQAALMRIAPLGRHGQADEVAGTIAFLASDDATYINGASIVVDGGMIAWGPEESMFFKSKRRYTVEVDVLVIGTGGAGLTAAIAAHDAGAQVLLVEKTTKVGGTTAVSGGVIWVPNNHHMAEVSIPDSREDALAYTRRLADGRSDDRLIERFIDTAPAVVKYLEERTPLRFKAIPRYPDYHPEFQGGKLGGRSLDPGLFDTHGLGPWKERLRPSAVFGATAMTATEATEWGVFSKPLSLPFKLLAERYKQGLVSYGAALVGGLLKALLDRRIEPVLEVRGHELLVEDDRVVGLRAEQKGKEYLVRARRGVVVATGGFEWNKDLGARFLTGRITHPNSPPCNDGDGLRMAMALGADLGNMSEAWWCPSVVIPGEEYEGRPLSRADFAVRSLPHSIIVNRRGQRFVNEAHNYNDMMKPFFTFDPVSYDRPNLPAYLVFDQSFRDKYMLMTLMPGTPSPPWLPQAATLAELARKIGVDEAGLAATVERFNGFAAEGTDRDFRRGESAYNHFYGDPEHHPNPNLGAIGQPPFYALEVFVGSIGTKGGPRVDADAQVLRVDGTPIRGLYAAGNVMAGVTGPGYPGAGSTIGTGMTFGYLAARHAAAKKD